MNNPPDVSLAPCPDYEFTKVLEATEASLEPFGGINKIIPHGSRILVKINLLNDTPSENAVVTHPAVTRAVIRLIKRAGAEPIVGEHSGPAEKGLTLRAFKSSGTLDVCRKEGVKIAPFNAKGFTKVFFENNKQLKTLYLAQDVLEADLVIGIAKLKTHMQTLFSGTVKNYFGCIPLKNRKAAHSLGRYRPFCEALVDIFQAVHPSFTFLDGIVGMEGQGPSSGKPKRLGLLMAAKDHVACDTVAMHLTRLSPQRYHVLKDAGKRGLGEDRLKNIRISGGPPESFFTPFEPPPRFLFNPPGFLAEATTQLFFQKLWIDPDRCKGCGICQKSCPNEAITLGPQAYIDTERCIECLCCMELCPHEAVYEKTSNMVRHLRKIKDYIRKQTLT